MKSQERINKEREARKTLWFVLAFAFILLVLILLLLYGANGAGYALNNTFDKVKDIVIEFWDKISFKLEGFFVFVSNK